MTRTPVIALVSGSFDPITEGHAYLLREAARLADVLHVVVGVNSSKRYYFTDEDRLRLTSGVVENLELNVPTHVHFSRDRFLIDVAADLGVTHLVRGVRNPQDFVYEAEMAQVNRDINPDIRTAYIFAPPELAKVSSSTVRSMVGLAQWKARIRPYVHPLVLEALEKRHHQSSCN